jgi:hypothetical protein
VRRIGAERSCLASLLDAEAAPSGSPRDGSRARVDDGGSVAGRLVLAALLELRNHAALVRMATRIDCTVAGASLKDVCLCTVRHDDCL